MATSTAAFTSYPKNRRGLSPPTVVADPNINSSTAELTLNDPKLGFNQIQLLKELSY